MLNVSHMVTCKSRCKYLPIAGVFVYSFRQANIARTTQTSSSFLIRHSPLVLRLINKQFHNMLIAAAICYFELEFVVCWSGRCLLLLLLYYLTIRVKCDGRLLYMRIKHARRMALDRTAISIHFFYGKGLKYLWNQFSRSICWWRTNLNSF